MSTHKGRVIAVGDLTADLVMEVPALPLTAGALQLARSHRLEPGGSGNLLITLARLGVEAVALGVVGEDLWGAEILAALEAEGVEVGRVRRTGSNTFALVFVSDSGEHALVGSFGEGPREMLEDEDRELIAGAGAVFTSGYSLRDARVRGMTLEALETAGSRGLPRFFDPGPLFQQLDGALRREAVSKSEVLLATEEELRPLLPGGLGLREAESLLRRPEGGQELGRESGPHTLVIKRGAAGCSVVTTRGGGKARRFPVAGIKVAARDSTAAGDCFAAGYLAAYLRGFSPEECARLANCVAAAAVQKVGGGRNVPTLEEVRRMTVKAGGGIRL